MDLKELWVGDVVKLISSNRIGKFEGIHKNGKARINVKGKIILSKAVNIKILSDEELTLMQKQEVDDEPNEEKKENIASPLNQLFYYAEEDEIDLHIVKLNPQKESGESWTILEYQIKCCELFINKAIANKKTSIKIIHGKGKGRLKSEIESLLKNHPNILQTFSISKGGGLEVIFNYSK